VVWFGERSSTTRHTAVIGLRSASDRRPARRRPVDPGYPPCVGAFPPVELTVKVAEKSLELARDATYTAIGLGLLTYQRAQVHRRGLERALRR